MRVLGLIAVVLLMAGGVGRAETLRISAAVSLKEALQEAAQGYEKASGDSVVFAFGSSGQLATQLRQGAAVDVYIPAAARQMDELVREKRVEPGTRVEVARNRLVLVVPASRMKDGPASFAALGDVRGKVAIGEPRTVPAGAYAMQVIEKLKLGEALQGKLVFGTNVRQVLTYVENGEVAAGVVYATDARESGQNVKVVALAESRWHEPIVYPGAVVSGSGHPEKAAAFLAYVTGPAGRKVLVAWGFETAEAATMPGKAP